MIRTRLQDLLYHARRITIRISVGERIETIGLGSGLADGSSKTHAMGDEGIHASGPGYKV